MVRSISDYVAHRSRASAPINLAPLGPALLSLPHLLNLTHNTIARVHLELATAWGRRTTSLNALLRFMHPTKHLLSFKQFLLLPSRLHTPREPFLVFLCSKLTTESLQLGSFSKRLSDRTKLLLSNSWPTGLVFYEKVCYHCCLPWKRAEKSIVRPIVCEDVDASLLLSIWQRDDGRSCILRTSEEKKHDEDPLLIHVLPPTLLHSPDMSQDVRDRRPWLLAWLTLF